jgi:mRNA interferase MazF
MQRGDLVVVAMQGDYGKPRPALVIQSDLFDELPTVTVLPLVSSQLVPAITRVDIAASDARMGCVLRHRSWCTGRRPSAARRSVA